MDFAQALRELWKWRLWVALGAVVATIVALSTAYELPSLDKRALSIGTANTQILIDSPRSSLTDLGASFKPLAERANVYSRFMTSRPVRAAIARQVGVDASLIQTEAPLASDQPRAAKEPAAAKRSNDLLGEQNAFRLRFQTDTGQPTITILSQAPNAQDAIRLADGGATGFASYVRSVQDRQGVPSQRRVTVRQLGRAEGGTVAEEVNVVLAALAFGGVFLAWCLLILGVTTVARNLRTLNQSEQRGLDGTAPDGPPA